jgi:predicted Zn-ribbon and HTH transcriptional regulator
MEPFDSQQTLRQQIIDLLSIEEMTVRDISQTARIPEKEVMDHLSHIERSLQRLGKKLIITPYRCLSCGFVFDKRTRLSRPGRCPSCKKSHLQTAFYHIK